MRSSALCCEAGKVLRIVGRPFTNPTLWISIQHVKGIGAAWKHNQIRKNIE